MEQRSYPDEIGQHLGFGGPDALRSMTKSALVLWSSLVGNEEVRSDPYEAARNFVTNGDEDFNLKLTCLDTRKLPFESEAKAAFGPLFNLLYVCSDDIGRVIGHFTLYNFIGWRFILAEHGGSRELRVALISNPENPSHWSSEAAAKFDLPPIWLDQSEVDLEMARQRLIEIGHHHKKTATERAVARIADEITQELGFESDQPLSHEEVEIFSKRASWRAAHLLTRMPESERLSPDRIAKLLGLA